VSPKEQPKGEIAAMAWKHLTLNNTNYFVNLDEVAYLQQYDKATGIVFSARGGDGSNLSITVDQSPSEILNTEQVS
jgi:hypothetical protein